MFQRTVSDKIRLEFVSPRHADALYELIDSNRDHLRPWLAWVDRTTCAGDVSQFIRRARRRHRLSGDITAAILHMGQLAGCIGLDDVDTTHRTAEIGYWLGGQFQGLGLITLSANALLKHAFDELDLNRIQLRAASDNERSKAVARRLGFTYEGTLRQVARMYDTFEDLDVYSMLRTEWEAMKTAP